MHIKVRIIKYTGVNARDLKVPLLFTVSNVPNLVLLFPLCFTILNTQNIKHIIGKVEQTPLGLLMLGRAKESEYVVSLGLSSLVA